MMLLNSSYNGDVLSKDVDKFKSESNFLKFKNIWVQRECYLHTLWQKNELPRLYENNEVIIPEGIFFSEGLIKKYRKRFSKSRKIDRKDITDHIQGKNPVIKFVSVKGNRPKTGAIENKLYERQLKKFELGRLALIKENFDRFGNIIPRSIKDNFKNLPFNSELPLNQDGSKKITSYYFENGSIVDSLTSINIPCIFKTALADSTFDICYEEEQIPNELFKTKLSIYLIKKSSI